MSSSRSLDQSLQIICRIDHSVPSIVSSEILVLLILAPDAQLAL
jgi:hypothetical protein